jgi:hypothetical protein
MVVLGVRLEMLGKVLNAFREDRDPVSPPWRALSVMISCLRSAVTDIVNSSYLG